MEYYDPVSNCRLPGQNLKFTQNELKRFEELKGLKPRFISKNLASTMKTFTKKFFQNGDSCYVCPSDQLGLRIDLRVLHDTTERAGNVVKAFVR